MRKRKLFIRIQVALSLAGLIIFLFMSQSCKSQSESQENSLSSLRSTEGKRATPSNAETAEGEMLITFDLNLDFSKYKVTFIELGADRCIPCRAMQPIMREIAREFKGQVQVVFYDVWKDPRPARKYGIQLIPTQVFIDQTGKEFFRHVGFFPKGEILQVLKMKGVG